MPRKSKKTASQSSPPKRDYIAIAHGYARDVLDGTIPACEFVKLACKRHFADLERQSQPDFPYRFDESKATRFCRFFEMMPHVKGRWTSATLTLMPFMAFMFCVVFGWVDANGNRRFRTAYIEEPRKNAKSTKSSVVGVYLAFADGEPGAEVYSAATTRDQARIVFGDAQAMARKTPELCGALGIDVLAHSIYQPATNSSFRALSADANSLDGLNIHGAIVDEFHAHQTPEVWNVIDTGTGARRQALKWIITTAGFNRSGICYELRTYAVNVLRGSVRDERFFGIIYTIDEGDDWAAESSWRKANPNYGVSVLPDDIATLCHQAQQSAQMQNSFLTKRLNCWVSADTAYFNMRAWDRCRRDVKLSDFDGCECYMGLDLAAKHDIAAKVLLFKRDEADEGGKTATHWYYFGKYYLPEDEIEQGINKNHAHYSGWARSDRLTLTPGNIIDYEFIERDILEDMDRFQVNEIVSDPREMTYLATRLIAQGAPVIEYPISASNISGPMKEMDALILANRFHHDGDPVMSWMVSNVVAHTDAKEMVFPRKDRPENKIDGPVSAMMALGRAMVSGDPYITPTFAVI